MGPRSAQPGLFYFIDPRFGPGFWSRYELRFFVDPSPTSDLRVVDADQK